MRVRRAVPAGVGVVLDRSLELSLPEGPYQFRMIRGPEYRVVTGHFVLEKTSLDSHTVRLPRMVDMLAKGWTSGDCLVPPSSHSLPLRMASEDLHVAATTETPDPHPIPGRKRSEPIELDPCWIRTDADHQDGLVFYGDSPEAGGGTDLPVARLAHLPRGGGETRVAIENPFAWALPVWLASERIDGVFVLGDWLRLDRDVLTVPSGRGPERPGPGDGLEVGYWAEKIHWNLLEAGFRLPPLAGSGSAGSATPVGYNRLYVGLPKADYRDDPAREVHRVATEDQWWAAAWDGHSIATNGPLLRPTVGGKIPGHVFAARDRERLELAVELNLSVRDPSTTSKWCTTAGCITARGSTSSPSREARSRR